MAIVDAMHAHWAPALHKWAQCDLDALEVVLRLLDELTVRVSAGRRGAGGAAPEPSTTTWTRRKLLPPWPEWERIFSTLMHRAQHTGLLRPGVDPETAAHLVVFGFVGELFATGYTDDTQLLHERVDAMTSLLLPAFATPEWTQRWEHSDWLVRDLPSVEYVASGPVLVGERL